MGSDRSVRLSMLLMLVSGVVCALTQSFGDRDPWGVVDNYPVKKLPQYAFGLGKRMDMDTGDDDISGAHLVNTRDLSYQQRLVPNARQYNFGMGKRSRVYGFGLGKRYDAWKNLIANPSFKQDQRRSKVYSFGLGKRDSRSIEETASSSGAEGSVH